MRSPTNRTKVVKRAALAVTSVVALVGGDTAAWGHGALPGGGDRVHTCLRGAARRTLRVVTDVQECTGSESGLDFPHNGTFMGVDIGGTVMVSLPGAAVGATTGPITVACTPDRPHLTRPCTGSSG